MSLVVEDGSGISNAEAYISVTNATTYHANRGNAAWAALTVPQQEQSLRMATDYMTQAYRSRWKGWRSNLAQALDWPRKSVILTDMAINYQIPYYVVPQEVINANAELALRASAGMLAPDLTQGVVSESVAGAVTQTFDRFSPQYVRYRAIDMILQPFLMSTGTMTSLGRA